MLLVIPTAGGERKFWVTRRLWLALLHEVDKHSPAVAEEPMASEPPATKPRPVTGEDAAGVVMLETVQFSKRADGSKALLFQSQHDPVPMGFKGPGLGQLRRMLETQADRAGWDAAGAMQRLKAGAIAGAAFRRAGK